MRASLQLPPLLTRVRLLTFSGLWLIASLLHVLSFPLSGSPLMMSLPPPPVRRVLSPAVFGLRFGRSVLLLRRAFVMTFFSAMVRLLISLFVSGRILLFSPTLSSTLMIRLLALTAFLLLPGRLSPTWLRQSSWAFSMRLLWVTPPRRVQSRHPFSLTQKGHRSGRRHPSPQCH